MINRWIHFWILPCSEISMLIEKKNANQITFLEKIRLKAHVNICKMCRAYQKKVTLIDQLLSKHTNDEKKEGFEEIEIQDFKQRMKEKMKK
ncbi:hypothetical protein [Bergeyella zoohelcum]|uniref:Zinc-finger domain-containing protein n=1 Tax=Bergeyella zoohelcum TaxID=1015 RepID=A0A376BXZ4_9FLAO|nr:hypothetical protein [Bergeyella zoohelcum]EKB61385.1 hypothetical protein HMPREF9700_00880 [Bergeyella zoohelcum CCUG 30536]SSZ46523.1 Uncharacterised protein [Bergeyella zoohelcum]